MDGWGQVTGWNVLGPFATLKGDAGKGGLGSGPPSSLYSAPVRAYEPVLVKTPSSVSSLKGWVNGYSFAGSEPVNQADRTGSIAGPAFFFWCAEMFEDPDEIAGCFLAAILFDP